MAELITFGEGMIRLSPPDFERIEQARCLNVNVGGSELNVAVAAARLGLSAAYVTRLTRSALGRIIENKVREHGVDTSHILWTDAARVGTYFVEFGASPRANTVIYDRRGSAIAQLDPHQFDWPSILQTGRAFHTSGITAALSPSAAEATMQAMKAANELGLTVSLDLNYRARLWSPEEARPVMERLASLADVLLTTEEDVGRVFGIRDGDHESVTETLARRFDLSVVAVTLREMSSVWRNRWSAVAYEGGAIHRAPVYDIEVVDRVGSGDCFAGGFLYGLLTEDVSAAVRYGVAVSALKQTHPGDLCWVTKSEVERVLANGDLRIIR